MPVHTSLCSYASTHTCSHTSMHTCHLAQGKPICRLDWASKTQSWQSRLWRNAGREDPHMSHFSGEAPLSTVQEAESGIKHFIASPVWGPQEAGNLTPVLQTRKLRFRAVLSFARITLLAASEMTSFLHSWLGKRARATLHFLKQTVQLFFGPGALSSYHTHFLCLPFFFF